MQKTKYYIIYKTTNKINNKIYIGQHTTNNINDGYIGSGRLLLEEVAIHGKDNFTTEVIHEYDNFEEMNLKEAEIVNEEFVNNPLTYNLICGGSSNRSSIPEDADMSSLPIIKDGTTKYISAYLFEDWKSKGWSKKPRVELLPKDLDKTRIMIIKDGTSRQISNHLLPRWEARGWVIKTELGTNPIPEDADMSSVRIIKDGVSKSIKAYLLPRWEARGWKLKFSK
jgi:hypothetical protein